MCALAAQRVAVLARLVVVLELLLELAPVEALGLGHALEHLEDARHHALRGQKGDRQVKMIRLATSLECIPVAAQ